MATTREAADPVMASRSALFETERFHPSIDLPAIAPVVARGGAHAALMLGQRGNQLFAIGGGARWSRRDRRVMGFGGLDRRRLPQPRRQGPERERLAVRLRAR